MTDAYPLAWPEGWPRTPADQQVDGRYQFKTVDFASGQRRPYTFARARDALLEELDRISGTSPVLSTNFQTSRGVATEGRRRPGDEGVAVYFTRGGRQLAMACDRFTRAEENMSSLRLAIAAIRQLERHGGGVMMEKAFQGFAALPAPASCWEILEIDYGAGEPEIQAAYRRLARRAHPDNGGSNAAMAELNRARDAALAKVRP